MCFFRGRGSIWSVEFVGYTSDEALGAPKSEYIAKDNFLFYQAKNLDP